MIFTLLAAMMAHIPVGQKQHKQERTAGPIQFWGTGVRLISIPSGCVTCTKDVIYIFISGMGRLILKVIDYITITFDFQSYRL